MYTRNKRRSTLPLSWQFLKKRQEELKNERNPSRILEWPPARHVTIKSPSSALSVYETSDIWVGPPFANKTTEDVFVSLDAEKKAVMPKIPRGLRMDLFNQMIKLNGSRGHPAILQTAQWYCDGVIDKLNESIKVIMATCFWMAQKMYGPVYNARRLLIHMTKAYECKLLVVTEKKMLHILKSPASPIVPQIFINYLSRCDVYKKVETILAATFICVAVTMVGQSLAEEYPSVIAAAAVHNAVVLLQKPRAMDRLARNELYKAAARKTESLSSICDMQKMAIRVVAALKNQRLVEYFNKKPYCIASKIIRSIDLQQSKQIYI